MEVNHQVQRAYQLTGQWVDFVQLVSTSTITTEVIIDLSPPADMVFIPGGNFERGDVVDGLDASDPVRSIYVEGFYLGRDEVTLGLWNTVYFWAIGNGYNFENGGAGKAADHPVHSVNWYEMVKWCNANYYASGNQSYDVSPSTGLHPDHATGGMPYSSPVGSFAANGYGACDMTGNMWEWYDGDYFITASPSNP